MSARLPSTPHPWVQATSWLEESTSLETKGAGQLEFSGLLQQGQEGNTKSDEQAEHVRCPFSQQGMLFLLGSNLGYSEQTVHWSRVQSREGFEEVVGAEEVTDWTEELGRAADREEFV